MARSEPTIITFPRSAPILTFVDDLADDDDEEALPSTLPIPPIAFSSSAPGVPRPDPAYDLHTVTRITEWDDITRHNPIGETPQVAPVAQTARRSPPILEQVAPASDPRPSRSGRSSRRRSAWVRFLLSMVVGFGIGLAIAAFYLTGAFHMVLRLAR